MLNMKENSSSLLRSASYLVKSGKIPWIKIDDFELGESDIIIEHLIRMHKSDLLEGLVLSSDELILGTAAKTTH